MALEAINLNPDSYPRLSRDTKTALNWMSVQSILPGEGLPWVKETVVEGIFVHTESWNAFDGISHYTNIMRSRVEYINKAQDDLAELEQNPRKYLLRGIALTIIGLALIAGIVTGAELLMPGWGQKNYYLACKILLLFITATVAVQGIKYRVRDFFPVYFNNRRIKNCKQYHQEALEKLRNYINKNLSIFDRVQYCFSSKISELNSQMQEIQDRQDPVAKSARDFLTRRHAVFTNAINELAAVTAKYGPQQQAADDAKQDD